MAAPIADKTSFRPEVLLGIFRDTQRRQPGCRVMVAAYKQIGSALEMIDKNTFVKQKPLIEWMRQQRKRNGCQYFVPEFPEGRPRDEITETEMSGDVKLAFLAQLIAKKGEKGAQLARKAGVSSTQLAVLLDAEKRDAILEKVINALADDEVVEKRLPAKIVTSDDLPQDDGYNPDAIDDDDYIEGAEEDEDS